MTEKISVAPQDPARKNSPVLGPTEEESTVVMDASKNRCIWNGEEFADGSLVESEGVTYECTYGRWARVE